MTTFTNPLTFPHLLLYLSKYSMDEMQQVYKAAYEKSMLWSSIPKEFIKMVAIPEKIMKQKSSNIKDYHNALPIILKRDKWNILEQENEQPNKIEYSIFNTWEALQNVQIKGILLVSEIYFPDYILISLIQSNYSLVAGDTLNLSNVTINISSKENTINQMVLGGKETSIDYLINNIDQKNLESKIFEYIKGIKNVTPVYRIHDNNIFNSQSTQTKKNQKKKDLKRNIIL